MLLSVDILSASAVYTPVSPIYFLTPWYGDVQPSNRSVHLCMVLIPRISDLILLVEWCIFPKVLKKLVFHFPFSFIRFYVNQFITTNLHNNKVYINELLWGIGYNFAPKLEPLTRRTKMTQRTRIKFRHNINCWSANLW